MRCLQFLKNLVVSDLDPRRTRKKHSIHLSVNNQLYTREIEATELLLDVLRHKIGLTGVKTGCLNGDCGACTVIVNKRPIKSCLMLAIEAKEKDITTIEGLNHEPIQEAFVTQFAFQCGYCTPGFIMNSQALLENEPNPSDEIIQSWLSSNICRCTGYTEIGKAVKSVIEGKRHYKD